MDLTKYVSENFLILIPVLYVLGNIIKTTPNIKNWLIPYLLLGISIIFGIFINGVNPDSIIQSILCTGTVVFTNQLIKQAKKKD